MTRNKISEIKFTDYDISTARPPPFAASLQMINRRHTPIIKFKFGIWFYPPFYSSGTVYIYR